MQENMKHPQVSATWVYIKLALAEVANYQTR
jgi:hypothetical protein